MAIRKGPADNMTYKDTFYFSKKRNYTIDELPSVKADPEVNDTIKENPYRSNVEIEGNEIVLKPNLDGIYKAVGKKHSKGGMQVELEPDSFVFSDDKTLKFTTSDHEMFDLKEPKNATPAEVLKKNVDVKHYNRLISNILDTKKDDLAKKSSLLMLQKYIDTLGNIAFVQEAKKNMPQGMPGFANPTPILPDLKEDEDTNKQYAKMGGRIMQGGGQYDPLNIFGTVKTPTYPKGRMSGVQPLTSGVPQQETFQLPVSTQCPTGSYFNYVTGKCEPNKVDHLADPTPKNITGQMDEGRTADWRFTPWQKESMLYNGLRWASVNREMPMRSHLNVSHVDPNLVNPEQVLGDARSGYNSTLRSMNSLNPYLSRSSANGAFGDYLDKAPGVRSQFDNQNAGIQNQFKQYNNQLDNTARGTNMQNDQTYWMQAAEGRKNFDNMKTYLGDQFMNERLGNAATNQSLAYNLLTQRSPAYGYNWDTGNFYRNPKNILDVSSDNSTREDIFAMVKNLKSQGYSDDLIGNIIKSKVFQSAKTERDYQKKGGMTNPYKKY